MTTILVTACEPSGDALGAALMASIKASRPGVRFIGGGGPLMKAEGLENALPTDKLAVMGPGDAVVALPRAKGLSARLGRLAAREKPEVAVLIDSWAFSKMAGAEIKKRAPETKLAKLAVPQVWASRPQRAAVAADMFDLLMCLLPFEPPYFEKHGGHAVFVGNPNFQRVARTPRSGPGFRARYGIGDSPLLLALPGSRNGEVKRLLPVFEETVTEAAKKIPGLKVAIIVADAVKKQVQHATGSWKQDLIVVSPDERFDAFDAGDVALAASGTVTTELALTSTPMVVTYKVGSFTAYWARKVITTPYVTVLNVAAGEEVIPERLQDDCTSTQLCADVVRLFNDHEARRKQMSAFRRLLPGLVGSQSAADAAAAEVLKLVDRDDRSDLDGSAAG
ncbi:lipid-A-disaccharide synthase [Parvularcula lutaonensis]|uniref:Lipid-A-disaccharide synthase n=1 Tax=Parvularcula lutaonensis TaxID=491923 RepID=A0ABV7MFC9_9PROT|nr:lipid-A-disaccharide synthase [Parvularcula lutaonensis]GGY54459.1 lipid-A-disaccharide synthase [Parvularcula lutaonensis]